MVERLHGDARKEALAGLADWSEVKGRDAIARSLKFKNFNELQEIHGYMAEQKIFETKICTC